MFPYLILYRNLCSTLIIYRGLMSGCDIPLSLILTFIRFHSWLPKICRASSGKYRLDAPDGRSSALGRIHPLQLEVLFIPWQTHSVKHHLWLCVKWYDTTDYHVGITEIRRVTSHDRLHGRRSGLRRNKRTDCVFSATERPFLLSTYTEIDLQFCFIN